MGINPVRQVRNVFKSIDRDIKKATASALNKTAKSALSHTLKEFKGKYNIKLKDLRSITTISKVDRSNFTITIKFEDKRFGLEKFQPTQRKKGIAATVKKGNRHVYKGSFFVNIKSNKTLVFKRETKSRLPIKRMVGMSPARILTTDESIDKMSDDFYAMYQTNFSRALEYYLK